MNIYLRVLLISGAAQVLATPDAGAQAARSGSPVVPFAAAQSLPAFNLRSSGPAFRSADGESSTSYAGIPATHLASKSTAKPSTIQKATIFGLVLGLTVGLVEGASKPVKTGCVIDVPYGGCMIDRGPEIQRGFNMIRDGMAGAAIGAIVGGATGWVMQRRSAAQK